MLQCENLPFFTLERKGDSCRSRRQCVARAQHLQQVFFHASCARSSVLACGSRSCFEVKGRTFFAQWRVSMAAFDESMHQATLTVFVSMLTYCMFLTPNESEFACFVASKHGASRRWRMATSFVEVCFLYTFPRNRFSLGSLQELWIDALANNPLDMRPS